MPVRSIAQCYGTVSLPSSLCGVSSWSEKLVSSGVLLRESPYPNLRGECSRSIVILQVPSVAMINLLCLLMIGERVPLGEIAKRRRYRELIYIYSFKYAST